MFQTVDGVTNESRANTTAVRLAHDHVLLIGGRDGANILSTFEIY